MLFTAIEHFPFLETLDGCKLSLRMCECEPSSQKERRYLKQTKTSFVVAFKMASEKKAMKFYLFNCDHTYDLKTVEELLVVVEEKYGFKIAAEPLYFGLKQMTELADETLPTLDMDFAIFALHANESRLSINETNAGSGYAKLYQALLQSTGQGFTFDLAMC